MKPSSKESSSMSTLHGILTELGIESPRQHAQDETFAPQAWIVDEVFIPDPGHCYELAFGKLFFDGQHRHVIKRVRVDGEQPSQWQDLDEERPLDPELRSCPVKAFRVIE
jgi:hypothetical protein